jgi:hypothetical protein
MVHPSLTASNLSWGDEPFVYATSSWYWGHANFGPYTLVWFDALSTAGVEYVSSYITSNGVVLAASNAAGSITVRPFGANSDYPPKITTGTPTGFTISATLSTGQTFVANATIGVVAYNNGAYGRYSGAVTGGIQGGVQYSGKGLWEQFKFAS